MSILEKLENADPNKRLIFAVAVSFLIMMPYYYFFPPENAKKDAAENKEVNKSVVDNSSLDKDKKVESVATSVKKSADIISTIDTPKYKMEIDSLGRISQVYLKDKRLIPEGKDSLQLFDETIPVKPLEIRFSDKNLNQLAFKNKYTASQSAININSGDSQTLTLTQDLNGEKVVKKIKLFYDGKYVLSLIAPKKDIYISNGFMPMASAAEGTSYGSFKGVSVKKDDNTIEKFEEEDTDENSAFKNVKFLASSDKYYTSMFFYIDKSPLDVIINKDENDNPIPFLAVKTGKLDIDGYIGAKEYTLLKNVDPLITDVIDYGFITFFARPIFSFLSEIYYKIGNWGTSIILFTILVRLVLFPLTYKSMVSMNRLKELSPKLKEIQTKYKSEPQKAQMHIMQLYKKHNVNPMGGCLPILLQLPVFFAIYRVLFNSVELKGANFALWITDLSKMDSYFVLPVLMGITMYLQQSLSNTNFTDPMQEKVFKFLPWIFTVMFATMPSGLVLYWVVSNTLSVLQQYIINKSLAKEKETKANH